MSHAAQLASSAVRDLDRIPARVLPAIIEFIYGPLSDNPRRLGKPLRAEYEGQWSALRSDYRILYEINDSQDLIVITRIDHRSRVYKAR